MRARCCVQVFDDTWTRYSWFSSCLEDCSLFFRVYIKRQKTALLEAISYTNNGKTATAAQQANVLRKVRQLETAYPVASIANPATSELLDGTWYLHYTSPSVVGDADDDDDATLSPNDLWKPTFAEEGASKIETRQFKAKGSVSAAGVTVDTSNKVVKQIFGVGNKRVVNEVNLDWGQIVVAGSFRQSSEVANRAVVAFDTAQILLPVGSKNKITIDLGFVFAVLALLRKSRDNGWLETTFLDKEMRIGRGNKGTMFVLTRSPDSVKP